VDWQYLKDQGFGVEFKARSTAANSFDVRMVDSPTGGPSWRTGRRIDIPGTNQWKTFWVGFKEMWEGGAPGASGWMNPAGEFDWNRIERLCLTNEWTALAGTVILDDLKILIPEPLTTGFPIYEDAVSLGVSVGTKLGTVTFDENIGQAGTKGIRWTAAGRYGSLCFVSNRPINWQYLHDQGYSIEFAAKATAANTIDVRFNNTTGAGPGWRIGKPVDIPADQTWRTYTIALSDMWEGGAPDGQGGWLQPTNLFSWNHIKNYCLTPEWAPLQGTITLDNIRLTD
jgi:hypothetical protein